MNNKFYFFFLLVIAAFTTHAQRTTTNTNTNLEQENKGFVYPKSVKKERYNVAVLTPLYLDSVDLEKNVAHIPKFMMPGIDFYQGIQIATDTLKNMGHKLNVYVYDSKSNYLNVQNIIESDKLDSMDLIIGNASVSDLKLLGNFAKQKGINFISAVSPSDADQVNNPYFTILQPRLSSHIEKIHKHILARSAEDNVLYLFGSSQSEKNGLNYFKEDKLNSLPSRFKEIELKEGINIATLLSKNIDSNYNTTIVLGTLDASKTYVYLKEIAPYAKRFNIKVYCMPTAEAIKAIAKEEEFPQMPIYYTTSYMIDKITPASMYIAKKYKTKMGSTTTDVVYKGFESLYYFASLLKKYGAPFNERLSDNSNSFITPYKIMPVKEKGTIQFYENKFLYLIRYEDGIMTYE